MIDVTMKMFGEIYINDLHLTDESHVLARNFGCGIELDVATYPYDQRPKFFVIQENIDRILFISRTRFYDSLYFS